MNWLDIVQVIGIIIVALGLFAQWRRTGTKTDMATGAEIQRGVNRDSRVDNLPCIRDPDYQRRQGRIEQQQNDIVERLKRIEEKVNGNRYQKP